MASTVTIEGKVVGRRGPVFRDWSISLPNDLGEPGDRIPLRDLISTIVQIEVQAFRERQAERRLARILSKEDIEQGAAAGKVDSGQRDLRQEVNPESAIETALQAFIDGLYYVFIDGVQVDHLDAQVTLAPDIRITFLRLVALAGG